MEPQGEFIAVGLVAAFLALLTGNADEAVAWGLLAAGGWYLFRSITEK